MRNSSSLPSLAVGALAIASLTTLSGCPPDVLIVEQPLGGSCLGCHEGITDIHPAFALSCVDCHGGNDQVELPANVDIRDQDLLRASHVIPREPEKWWANGVDDDGDGIPDPEDLDEFFNPTLNEQLGFDTEKEFEFDSEMNRDVNYLRFINPGDLRVAEVTCGGSNRNANEAMICHAEVVYDVRRSIMSAQSGVPSGALYGNAQLPKAADYGAAFAGSELAAGFDERDPRIGRAGYAFDFDTLDAAYDKESNTFDTEILARKAGADCNDDPTANCDLNDVGFEALAGPLIDDGSNPHDPGVGLTRTKNPLKFPDRAVNVLQYIQNRTNRPFPPPGTSIELRLQKIIGLAPGTQVVNLFDGEPITNPVDAALRNFRAYHVLNFMSPADNFPNGGIRIDDTNRDNTLIRNNNNPFGRFGSSGCTACHVEYDRFGNNQEPIDRTVADNGRQPHTDLPEGIQVELGQRAYARRHEIRTAVQLQTCASCHGFVTRVDYALEGKYELEVDFNNAPENVQTMATTFETPNGTSVNLFNNLAEFDQGELKNSGEGVSEDKDNDGELDPGEDLNGNGLLDIPDRVARQESFDGRQSKLIYGGANGSTRLIDIHIEVGMACSDCHVTSVHGDGNIYTRNWDAEPLECEDCHGTPYERTNFVTSGPNGGDRIDDRIWETPFGKPWFEEVNGQVIEHSRTQAGLSWVVPQLKDEAPGDAETGRGFYAHQQPLESGAAIAGEERALAHIAESGKPGGLECYSCHSTWQPNCFTCHLKMDVAKPRQEIWFGDDEVEDIFFQLFSYTRSPFYLGRAGDVEGNKISPYRSTMQVHLTVVAGDTTLLDNAMAASEDGFSSMVSNPYFPHTVRETETKSCARCHTLVDAQNRVMNDHLITEATGQGTGRYMNVGDWALAASANGLEQIDLKKEAAGLAAVTFPGFIFDDTAPRTAPFAAGAATDVTLLRGVAFVDGSSDLTDVGILATANGAVVIDVTGRDNAGLPPSALGVFRAGEPIVSVDVIDVAASQSKRFMALTAAGELCTVDYLPSLAKANVENVLGGGGALDLDEVGACVDVGRASPTKVRLHGQFALVTHADGVSIFDVDAAGDGFPEVELGAPGDERIVLDGQGAGVVDVVSSGRFVYGAAGADGVLVWDVGSLFYDLPAEGDATQAIGVVDAAVLDVGTADARGIALHGSHLLVAGGANGLHIVDVAVPADPVLEQTMLNIGGGDPLNEANAVVVAAVPARSYAIVADGSHGLRAINITPREDWRTRLADVANDPDAPGNRGFRLSNERADPLTPFDPKNDNLDEEPADPLKENVFTYPTSAPAVAVARGLCFDNIADKSSRQLRDGWSIGSRPIETEIVKRMRNVIVREVVDAERGVIVDERGDGLGCVVRDGDPVDAKCVATIPE